MDERCIGWLKGCRRVATLYEKLASHFLAMIQRCLRLLDPSNENLVPMGFHFLIDTESPSLYDNLAISLMDRG
ncbi:MAG: hypothetical protein D6826_02635 [Alphaproteobacteria bacterium]|nr:MAG: hypothetical protein D6826_02635 [Alphaproteobacteria bacterium]